MKARLRVNYGPECELANWQANSSLTPADLQREALEFLPTETTGLIQGARLANENRRNRMVEIEDFIPQF